MKNIIFMNANQFISNSPVLDSHVLATHISFFRFHITLYDKNIRGHI